jgi:hypothetical protein
MAAKIASTTSKKRAQKTDAEKPVTAEIERSAARSAIPSKPSEPTAEALEIERLALPTRPDPMRTLLQFGLWHDQEQPGIRLEDTTMRFAAATLKAVVVALAAHEENSVPEGGEWCTDHEFNANDAIIAIGGVAAILDQAKHLIYEVDQEARRAAKGER